MRLGIRLYSYTSYEPLTLLTKWSPSLPRKPIHFTTKKVIRRSFLWTRACFPVRSRRKTRYVSSSMFCVVLTEIRWNMLNMLNPMSRWPSVRKMIRNWANTHERLRAGRKIRQHCELLRPARDATKSRWVQSAGEGMGGEGGIGWRFWEGEWIDALKIGF